MAQPGVVTTTGDGGFLDRFPLWVQLLILVGGILLIWIVIHYFLIAPMLDEASKKNEEALALRKENEEANRINQYIAEYTQTLEGLNAQLDSLKVRLPEEREVTNIFENTKLLMQRSGLTLVNFKTGDKATAEVPKEYYTEVPTAVTVVGKYENIQGFFRTLASYERIVNITDLSLTKAEDRYQAAGSSTQAQFNLTAFYISTQNRQNLEAKDSGVKPADPNKKPGDANKPAEAKK